MPEPKPPPSCKSCPFASCEGCEFQSICSIEGCEKPRYKRYRMCSMHIARKKRHGDPNYDPKQGVIERATRTFWSKVDKTDDCWLWTGALDNCGYGYFRVALLPGAGAHRFAWRISGRGDIPEGMQLDHLCHTRDTSCRGGETCPHRRCVNPDHLEIVTPQENALRSQSIAAQNARKPVCPKCGRDWAVAKRGSRSRPGRWCPPCHNERARQRNREQRETAS